MALFCAVGLLSAAALAFEVLLVRLISIAEWHHFAFMIISLALLGYGASGTVLAIARERLLAAFSLVFPLAAGLFGISALAGFAVSQAIPLNLLELPWDPRQLWRLLFVYLVLAVPFLFAALAIGVALARASERAGRIYSADLIGAGIGALAVIGALFALPPADCLKLIGALGLIAAACGSWRPGGRRAAAALLIAAPALALAWPDGWASPRLSPYKGLSMALALPGARVIAKRSSPLGLLTVVESPEVPFRYAPGLSLNAAEEPPRQLAVFTDGGGMTAITRFTGTLAPLAYLDLEPDALPYHLSRRSRVAVLGAGGGGEVLRALYHRARRIDAVDINPQMIDLVRSRFADFAGHLYQRPEVTVHVGEARHFIASSRRRYDVITLSSGQSFTAAAGGLHALSPGTLYTVEAFKSYLQALTPEGLLAVSFWFKVPPRAGLKLFATAIDALHRLGIRRPGAHLALVRGWRTATLVLARAPLTAAQRAAVRAFATRRGFDLAYLPGMRRGEANRHNILDRPYLFDGATALLGPRRQRFLADYAYDVRPASDDRPYFFHFLKGRTLIALLRNKGRGGFGLIDWGYPVLLATLLQAALVSVVLILLPLLAVRKTPPLAEPPGGRHRARTFGYFFALGLAFLFVEMAFIQHLQLFLGHPLYAVAVGISGFLVFAGIGSGLSRRWTARLGGARRAIGVAAVAIAALALLAVAGLPALFAVAGGLGAPARFAVALALIAPLALFMGLPFPIGLADTAARAPALVPWAWGVNGCASVLSAVLATVLAIHFGFSAVMLAAIGLYALAAALFAAPSGRRAGPGPSG